MNPFELLKNMTDIKGQVEAFKAKTATIKSTGYACGNMVEAVANGNMEIESIKIDPQFIKPENPELLEVMVTSAVNTALKNVLERVKEEAGKETARYGISL